MIQFLRYVPAKKKCCVIYKRNLLNKRVPKIALSRIHILARSED